MSGIARLEVFSSLLYISAPCGLWERIFLDAIVTWSTPLVLHYEYVGT